MADGLALRWAEGGLVGLLAPPSRFVLHAFLFLGNLSFLGNRLRGTVVFCFTRLFGLFLGFRYLYVFRIIRFDSSFGTVRLSSPPFPSSLSFPSFMYELD